MLNLKKKNTKPIILNNFVARIGGDANPIITERNSESQSTSSLKTDSDISKYIVL